MITDATIAEVRQKARVEKVVGAVVKLSRAGRSMKGLCPFHKEKSPSFYVTPEKGSFHCFGCGEHGSSIDFVMKTESLTFPEAVRLLAEKEGIEIEEGGTEQERAAELAKRRARDEIYDVMRIAALYFVQQLVDAKIAHAEIARRGLDLGDQDVTSALAAFHVGYAPAGWDGLTSYLRAQGISPALGEAAGLLLPRKGGGGHYDRFRHRLMFAVSDLQGRPIAFSGRILPDEHGVVDKETGKYMNSPETAIYRKAEHLFGLYQARQAIREEGEAVVVEGNFDVFSLHARGLRHVVAPLGTAFTEQQAALLHRFTQKAVLFFDGDSAGKRAVRASAEPTAKAGLSVLVVPTPDGRDPDELAQERGARGVRSLLSRARGVLEARIDHELASVATMLDAKDAASCARRIRSLLDDEDDVLVRALATRYADEASRRLAPPGTEAYRRFGQVLARPFVLPRVAPAPELDQVLWGVLGPMLDYPSCASAPQVTAALASLPQSAQDLIASIACGATEMQISDPVLARAVRERASAPQHDHELDALTECLANLEKVQARPSAHSPRKLRRCASIVERQAVAAGAVKDWLRLRRERTGTS